MHAPASTVHRQVQHSRLYRTLRWIARHSWAILIAYVGIVVQNISYLLYYHDIPALLRPSLVGQAFLFPKIAAALSPVLSTTVFLVVVISLMVWGYFLHEDGMRDTLSASRKTIRQPTQPTLAEELLGQEQWSKLVQERLNKLEGGEASPHTRREPRTKQAEAAARASTVPASTSLNVGPNDQSIIPPSEQLIGRDDELKWLIGRLVAHARPRVTALTGAAGIGKTALVAVALQSLVRDRQFPDGIAVVLCNDLKSPTEVLQHIIERFDLYERQPDEHDKQKLQAHAQELLEGKDALVALDHVEDWCIVDGILPLLQQLEITLLITARQKPPRDLLPEGASHSLESLSQPSALALLAKDLKAGPIEKFTPQQRESAVQIVESLDHHALAISLLAASATAQREDGASLASLAQELASTSETVAASDYSDTDPSETAALHAMLRAFAFSEGALPANALRLFAATAAIATEEFGENTVRELAESLQLTPAADNVSLLITHALVSQRMNASARMARNGARLIMHPILRSFAKQRLLAWEPGDRYAAYEAVARHFATYVTEVERRIEQVEQPGRDMLSDSEDLRADQNNIAGALFWAHATHEQALVADICWGMRFYWERHWRTELSQEYLPWGVAAATDIAEQTPSVAARKRLADIEVAYGQLLRRIGDPETATWLLEKNRAVYHDLDDPEREASVYYQLGQVARVSGKLSEAETYFKSSLGLQQVNGNLKGEGANLRYLGRIAHERGRLDDAKSLFERSLAIAIEVGDQHGEGLVRSQLGLLAMTRQHWDDARTQFRLSLRIYREVHDRQGQAIDLTQLGRMYLQQGRLNLAERYILKSLAIRRAIQDKRGVGLALTTLGQLALARGEPTTATENFEQALDIAREVYDLRAEGVNRALLGKVHFDDESRGLEIADAYYKKALEIAQQVQNRRGEGANQLALGRIAQKRHQVEVAEARLIEALTIAEDSYDTRLETSAAYALGQLAQEQGKLDDAEYFFQKALICDRDLHDHDGEATDLALLGQVTQTQGKLDDAARYYQQALALQYERGDHAAQSFLLTSLGEVAQRQDRLEDAKKFYEQALSLDRHIPDRLKESRDLVILGQVEADLGDVDNARLHLQEALNIQRLGRDALGAAITFSVWSAVERAQGDRATALRFLLTAYVGLALKQSGRLSETGGELTDLRRDIGEKPFMAIFQHVKASEPEPAYIMLAEDWADVLEQAEQQSRLALLAAAGRRTSVGALI